jgi:hypothetical protein
VAYEKVSDQLSVETMIRAAPSAPASAPATGAGPSPVVVAVAFALVVVAAAIGLLLVLRRSRRPRADAGPGLGSSAHGPHPAGRSSPAAEEPPRTAAFCTACGVAAGSGDRFCHGCGAPLG